MALKTTYKDDLISGGGTTRKYTMTTNSDGTVSFEDSTTYEQEGDYFGAGDINSTNTAVNKLNNVIEVTLTVSGWSGSSAPYSQSVSVSDVSADDNPILVSVLADGATADTQKAYNKAFGIVSSGTAATANGSITFKVYKKPTIDVTVGLRGV